MPQPSPLLSSLPHHFALLSSLPPPSPCQAGYDLSFIWDQPDPPELAWQQFLQMGLHEGRPYRFSC